MSMRPNWPTTAVGCTSVPMDMSGFPMFTITHGGRIIMDVGSGIPSVDGRGSHTSPGDGAFPITGVGTGESVWAGIGSRPDIGDRLGSIGTAGMIISAGAR